MASETRRYAPGEIIFREGEISETAFVIEVGRVELIKTGKGGLVRLALLGVGDLFGEMGVLDKGPRSATARAEEDCLLQVIPRADFLRMVEDDPATALKIMTRMAKRLRDTDDRLAGKPEDGGGTGNGSSNGKASTALVPVAARPPAPALRQPTYVGGIPRSSPAGRLIHRIVTAFRGGPTDPEEAKRRPKVVAVTPLSLEPEYDQRPFLIEALSSLDRATFKETSRDLPPPDSGQFVRDPARARVAARQMLADEKADLIIFGGEDDTGRVIELRFASSETPDPDRLGSFPPEATLVIPADFDAAWAPLIKAVVLAALGGETPALPALLDESASLGLNPPAGMSASEQAAVYACYGYACARAMRRRRDLVDRTMEAWTKAIERLPRDAEDDWLVLHRLLGMLLQMKGEQGRDEGLLREAAAAYEQALEAIHRDTDPMGWAALEVRLAQTLFRIDMIGGDETALRAALTHYQAALTVFSRADHPWRWAELMTAVGQVLQVFGDHLKSVEVLKKAVEVCRSAMEVRTAEVAPLLYAATRNNMGSALFLLAKHTSDPEYMRLAAVAFRDAMAVHRSTGSKGPLAKTIDKNMRRADALLQRHESRPVAVPIWAAEEAPETSDSEDEPPAV